MSELVSEFWPVQPEPGSVADQLIKKGEARGEALGETRGKSEERRNTIRILQSILGVAQSSDEEMAGKDLAALEVMIDELRDRISSRMAGQ